MTREELRSEIEEEIAKRINPPLGVPLYFVLCRIVDEVIPRIEALESRQPGKGETSVEAAKRLGIGKPKISARDTEIPSGPYPCEGGIDRTPDESSENQAGEDTGSSKVNRETENASARATPSPAASPAPEMDALQEKIEAHLTPYLLRADLLNLSRRIMVEIQGSLAASHAKPEPRKEVGAWPVSDVLEKLADAADHLRRDHSCDQHGYEEVAVAAEVAREHARVIRAQGKPEADQDCAGEETDGSLMRARDKTDRSMEFPRQGTAMMFAMDVNAERRVSDALLSSALARAEAAEKEVERLKAIVDVHIPRRGKSEAPEMLAAFARIAALEGALRRISEHQIMQDGATAFYWVQDIAKAALSNPAPSAEGKKP